MRIFIYVCCLTLQLSVGGQSLAAQGARVPPPPVLPEAVGIEKIAVCPERADAMRTTQQKSEAAESCATRLDAVQNGAAPESRRRDGAPFIQSKHRTMRDWFSGLDALDEKTMEGVKRAMQDMLGAPMGPDAEHAFVSMMIGHHAGALGMAVEAMISSNDLEMIALSRQVVVAQLDEIIACKQWLREHRR